MSDPKVIEGVVYDPVLDSHARAVLTDEGEYVYIESLLETDDRVRVTIEVLKKWDHVSDDADVDQITTERWKSLPPNQMPRHEFVAMSMGAAYCNVCQLPRSDAIHKPLPGQKW